LNDSGFDPARERSDGTLESVAATGSARSEALFRFLDRLGQEAARSSDADEIMAITTRLTAEHLGLSNCAYADMDEDQDGFTIRGNWHAPGSPSIVGHYSLADFGKLAVQELGAGRPLIINDNLQEIAPEEAKTFQDIGIGATICMPLVKAGRLTALMAIHDRDPHYWSDYELAVIREVTERSWAHVERVRAQARLRESEERYRTLFGSIDAGFCVVEVNLQRSDGRSDYRVVEANPAFYPQSGLPEAVLGKWLRDAAPDLEDQWYETYGRVARPGRPERFEQGSVALGRWFDVYAFRIDDPALRRVAILFNDISERRRTEQALTESEARLRALTDNLPSGMVYQISTGRDGSDRRFLYVSQSHEKLTGIPAAAVLADPMVAYGLILPEDRPGLAVAEEEAIRAEQPFDVEARFRHRNGEVRWCRIISAPRRQNDGSIIWDGIQIDITEQKELEASLRELNDTLEQRVTREISERVKAEDALRQAQKMEAIGQLTGGIAHDFNNLLTPIVGALDILRGKDIDDRSLRLVEGALTSAERARVLIARLLSFARRQRLESRDISARGLLVGMADLVARSVGPTIQLKIEPPDAGVVVRVDPNQLELALLNLVVNARDAIPDGGTITLSAAEEELGESNATMLAPGTYVRFTVADTGQGMDEATRRMAVEPFYSTKGTGRGTGLGLSMVHGLALQSGGNLAIRSEIGQGTTVDLWLPAGEHAEIEREVDDRDVPEVRPLKVLLVDDEDLVRAATADMLTEAGHAVDQADSGGSALSLFDSDPRYDVVITDYAMPLMSGAALIRKLRQLAPSIPALLITGYASASVDVPADVPRIAKPFRAAELLTRVEEVASRRVD
jgi:PAS domain S-box-containing protein